MASKKQTQKKKRKVGRYANPKFSSDDLVQDGVHIIQGLNMRSRRISKKRKRKFAMKLIKGGVKKDRAGARVDQGAAKIIARGAREGVNVAKQQYALKQRVGEVTNALNRQQDAADYRVQAQSAAANQAMRQRAAMLQALQSQRQAVLEARHEQAARLRAAFNEQLRQQVAARDMAAAQKTREEQARLQLAKNVLSRQQEAISLLRRLQRFKHEVLKRGVRLSAEERRRLAQAVYALRQAKRLGAAETGQQITKNLTGSNLSRASIMQQTTTPLSTIFNTRSSLT